MSERKEPTSALYQWTLAYMMMLNVMFAILDIGGLCVLAATS